MLNLQTASFSNLKQYATDNNIVVEGDRRRKQSYVAAIQAYQASLEAAFAAVPAPAALDIVLDEDGNLHVVQASHEEMSTASFAPVFILLVQIVAYALGTTVLLVVGAAWAVQKAIAIAINFLFPPIDSRFHEEVKDLMAIA